MVEIIRFKEARLPGQAMAEFETHVRNACPTRELEPLANSIGTEKALAQAVRSEQPQIAQFAPHRFRHRGHAGG